MNKVVKVSQSLVQELESSINEDIILQNGQVMLLEHEVKKVKGSKIEGLKIEVFSDEHPPPHFRVKYGSEKANFRIKDCSKMNGDLNKWTKHIKKWHGKNKYHLIRRWDETRPTDCTVGKYKFDKDEIVVIEKIFKDIGIIESEDLQHLKKRHEELFVQAVKKHINSMKT